MLTRLRLAFRVLIVCHHFLLNGSQETKIPSSRGRDRIARITRDFHFGRPEAQSYTARTLPSEENCFLGSHLPARGCRESRARSVFRDSTADALRAGPLLLINAQINECRFHDRRGDAVFPPAFYKIPKNRVHFHPRMVREVAIHRRSQRGPSGSK